MVAVGLYPVMDRATVGEAGGDIARVFAHRWPWDGDTACLAARIRHRAQGGCATRDGAPAQKSDPVLRRGAGPSRTVLHGNRGTSGQRRGRALPSARKPREPLDQVHSPRFADRAWDRRVGCVALLAGGGRRALRSESHRPASGGRLPAFLVDDDWPDSRSAESARSRRAARATESGG